MGPTEINKDGSFYRTQRSSALAVLKLPPPPTPPTKKRKKKISFIIVRQFGCFSGLPMGIHVSLQILCKTVIARKIIMNYIYRGYYTVARRYEFYVLATRT